MSTQEHIDLLNKVVSQAMADAATMERECCIAAIEEQKAIFMSPEYAAGQPLSSMSERLACDSCIDAIRRLQK